MQLAILDQLHKILGNYSPERKMIMSRSEIYTEIAELPEIGEIEKLKGPEEIIHELPESGPKEKELPVIDIDKEAGGQKESKDNKERIVIVNKS